MTDPSPKHPMILNNQEMNIQLQKIQKELDTLKESLSLNDANINLLSLIVSKDEKIKDLEHTISVQRIISDGTFAPAQTMDNRTGSEILSQIKEDIKTYEMGRYNFIPNEAFPESKYCYPFPRKSDSTPELCVGCTAIPHHPKTGKCFFWHLGRTQCGFKDMASMRMD